PISLRPFSAPPARASPRWAHLLPKLRCQFAEFLNQSSLKRLGILYPSTESVCGTVTYSTRYEVFLGSVESVTLRPIRNSSSPLGVNDLVDLPARSAYGLKPGYPTPG